MSSYNRRNSGSVFGVLAAVILLLLVVAAIFVVVRSFTRGGAATDPSAPPAETQEAAPQTPTAPPATPSPSLTPPPTATARPTPTPEPTPEATPVPDKSGSFTSDSGANVNIRADWSVSDAGGGKATVTVNVYLVSYSVFVNEKWEGLTISVGGESESFTSAAVSSEEDTLQEHLLGSRSFTVDASGGSVPIAVSYAFRGTYSGKEIDVITASGTAILK